MITEKYLSYRTNPEIADLLNEAAHQNQDQDLKLILMEAARRLRIEPRIPFNDEQFDI